MLSEFVGALELLSIALILCWGLLWGSRLLERRLGESSSRASRVSLGAAPAADSEADPESEAKQPASSATPSSLHRVALLFLLFNVALVYFLVWGATLRETGLMSLITMLCFALPLAVGLAYAWSKGVLD